ncbi:MAG: O-antigen ligase family protein [Actinobacteria bacterium]|nr:O-antigen ligase family protein [Actinomycetota bacterium]
MAKKKKAEKKREYRNKEKQVETASTSIFDKINYFLLLSAIFLIPIIFVTFIYDPFDLMKNVVFRIIVSFMLLFYILDIYLGKKKEIFFHPAAYLMIAFVLWTAYATTDSVVFWTSVWGKYRRFEGLVAFITYLVFLLIAIDVFSRDRRRIETAVKVSLFSAILVSTYGILQYLGYDILKWGSLPFEERRSFATLGNPALLAGYLVAVFPLAFAYSIFTKNLISFSFGVISTLLTFTCLITAFNRTSWLAAALSIFCMVIFIWFLARKRAVGTWNVRNMAIIVLILVSVFIALSIHSQMQKTPLTVVKRIEQMTEFGGSFAHRLEIWKAGLRMIYKEPFNGLGPDTFRSTSRIYQGEKYGHIAADIVADNAHNYEIHIAAGTGVIGLLFFLSFLIYVFFEAVRIIYQKSFSENGKAHIFSTKDLASLGVNLGLLISFLAYLFQMITSVSVIGSTIMWWFAFTGILSQGKALKTLRPSLKQSHKVAALVGTVVIVLVAIILNVSLVIADHYYLVAKRYTGYPEFLSIQEENIKKAMRFNPWLWDIPGEMARSYYLSYKSTNNVEYLDSALSYALLAESIDKNEADIKSLLIQIYLEKGLYDKGSFLEAEVVASEMAKMMPHHYVSWLLLGEVYYFNQKFEKAIEALENAIRNNPYSAQSYYVASLCYRSLGDNQKAAEFLEKARKLDPNIDKE